LLNDPQLAREGLEYNAAYFGEKFMQGLMQAGRGFVAAASIATLTFAVLLLVMVPAEPVLAQGTAQGKAADPWEGLNRPLYRFNQVFDGMLVKPVALGYSRVVPRIAKRGVSNFLNNLDDINVVVNDLLQLKMRNAMRDSCRLVINTTAGLGGFIDVASNMGIYKNYEDFGQTLGHWGMGDGGYLVLPFLGASTVRDTFGFVSDLFFNPVFWINDSKTRSAVYMLDTVDTRLTYVAAESMITGDEYIFVRNAYLQRRAYLVADGEVYDEFDDF
jgi:phospholipid-binding lipoprotein MlaA